jgi:hypothetical protein
MSRPVTTIGGEAVDRARIEALLAEDALLVLEDCDLTFEDRLLVGADLRRMSFRAADLGGLELANAKLFAGATISTRQAAELVRALGLNVAWRVTRGIREGGQIARQREPVSAGAARVRR